MCSDTGQTAIKLQSHKSCSNSIGSLKAVYKLRLITNQLHWAANHVLEVALEPQRLINLEELGINSIGQLKTCEPLPAAAAAN